MLNPLVFIAFKRSVRLSSAGESQFIEYALNRGVPLLSSTLRRCWSCTAPREGGGVVVATPVRAQLGDLAMECDAIPAIHADDHCLAVHAHDTALEVLDQVPRDQTQALLCSDHRRDVRPSAIEPLLSALGLVLGKVCDLVVEHWLLVLVEVGADKATSGSRQTDGGTIQGSGKQRGWDDKDHTWCYRIRTVSGGAWIADIQDQGVFPVRRSRGNRRCRVVRGRGPRSERFSRCRPGRRCDQAPDRPQGGGRSAEFRLIVLFHRGDLAFFVYGFAKSGRENLRRDELPTFRRLADEYLALDRASLAAAQAVGAIIEVNCDDQAVQE